MIYNSGLHTKLEDSTSELHLRLLHKRMLFSIVNDFIKHINVVFFERVSKSMTPTGLGYRSVIILDKKGDSIPALSIFISYFDRKKLIIKCYFYDPPSTLLHFAGANTATFLRLLRSPCTNIEFVAAGGLTLLARFSSQ